ncbi:hypothetical protein PV05_08782 [Exophiala xenobiotica]|uniref:Major facilitator superfamily (MFS) profile domain-containing protein n=1 Tax=Exophiala xenobiotica TaxID=348802 RepID=A0A0D2EEV0_9EURO|nr:uncharacterized protein PV05_08782 [Exophiala xenobiotica]KIW53190.1 hypothetical protein PV05_08782 [Exophiala xenobiotica]
MASPVLLSLLLFMPETSAPNILLRRARRLRELTGDSRLQSQSEIDQRSLSACDILFSALLRPMEIMFKDPSIFFVHVYTGYFYGDFYTFFEVFTLVFLPFYGFNLGQTGLAFLSCMIGVMVAILGYFAYLYFYMVPDNLKERPPRARTSSCPGHCWLVPAANWTIPFRMDVRLQDTLSIFIYIPFSYLQYAASLFAGNSVMRSATACASAIFARPLFINLGVHRGVSVLAGLSVMGIFGTTVIYIFGKQLRARSKFAQN